MTMCSSMSGDLARLATFSIKVHGLPLSIASKINLNLRIFEVVKTEINIRQWAPFLCGFGFSTFMKSSSLIG